MIGTVLTPKSKNEPAVIVTAAAGGVSGWIVQRADGVHESPRLMTTGEMAAGYKVAGIELTTPTSDAPDALAIREQDGWNRLGSAPDADELLRALPDSSEDDISAAFAELRGRHRDGHGSAYSASPEDWFNVNQPEGPERPGTDKREESARRIARDLVRHQREDLQAGRLDLPPSVIAAARALLDEGNA